MDVKHKSYGVGTVVGIADDYIRVRFNKEIKSFQFPEAFGKFLETEDAALLKKIKNAQNKKEVTAVTNKVNISPDKQTDKFSSAKKTYSTVMKMGENCPLVGDRAQTIPVNSDREMFEIIGYMARPGRITSIEAEVPKDGRDKTFERLFPGQKYRPIELGDTPSGMPNKLSPQFRINFGNLRNCPQILRVNMGKGNGSCVGRINKSKFVITIVQDYGFRFGEYQDINAIRSIAIKSGYEEDFIRGYNR